MLDIARAVQGLGGAIVMPLTLTILSAAVPPARRGLALGAWGAIGGLAIAIGPIVGGAVVEGFSWQWIFWLNVPIGILLVPLALGRLRRRTAPPASSTCPASASSAPGCSGSSGGSIRGQRRRVGRARRSSPRSALGACSSPAFVAWELRAAAPDAADARSSATGRSRSRTSRRSSMFFGMFGSIFLLTQYFQTVQGYSPLASGPADPPVDAAMPMFVAPFAGAMSDRVGAKRILGVGLTLQAVALGWIAFVSTPTVAYASLVIPFILAGVGMALFFTPMANLVLSSVGREREGQASGANNAVRELGGVFGVAVLASVFSTYGGYGTGESFVAGMTPALWIGAIAVGVGAVAAFAIPSRRRSRGVDPEPIAEAA